MGIARNGSAKRLDTVCRPIQRTGHRFSTAEGIWHAQGHGEEVLLDQQRVSMPTCLDVDH